MKEYSIPIRLGIMDYLLRGDISLFEFGVYTLIHLQANYSSGLWHGSAPRIAHTASRGADLRKIQRAIEHLTLLGLLKPFTVHGRRGNYPVLINKFTVRSGALKGLRLNALDSDDWRHPRYEACADTDAESVAEDAPIHKKEKGKQESLKPAPKTTAPADDRFQPFFSYAFESYKAKHQRPPIWTGKDRAGLKNLLGGQSAAALPLERLKVLWEHYCTSTEAFTAKQADSLAYFCSNLDKFSDGPILEKPVGGTHGKPTVSDNVRATLDAFNATEQKRPC